MLLISGRGCTHHCFLEAGFDRVPGALWSRGKLVEGKSLFVAWGDGVLNLQIEVKGDGRLVYASQNQHL